MLERIEKILLANSGTGHTEEMLKMLMELPSFQGANVTVLHVVPPQITTEEMTRRLEEGGQVLSAAIQNLGLEAQKVEPVLIQGDPKDIVVKMADETETDLIIMGSRGLKRIQSILENSVSQYVFQLAARPMLLVKDDLYVKKINRVMVAVDQSETAKDTLALAFKLVRDIKGGQLVLVHTNPDMKLKPGEIVGNPEEDPILVPAIAEAKKMGINYKAVAPEGKPGERICQVAEDLNVDLLILGSPDRRPTIAKGLPDLDRLLGQSLSDYVRVYANCPVLLVRTPT
ncbi:universal stress protein [Vacuolonema iberomarrocanum]|uniref:universal stress protein n=1 Tax=Vacuolonema iberomarrocanum TaxID=3454632 RepID=UPI0019FA4F78|nr:universal stress protein [filamentous cyanobacterium LEGE 07170]